MRRSRSTAPCQIELRRSCYKTKRTYRHEVNDEELRQTINTAGFLYDSGYAIATSGNDESTSARTSSTRPRPSSQPVTGVRRSSPRRLRWIHKYFHDDVQKKAMRAWSSTKVCAPTAARPDEIRPDLVREVGYPPAAHGSAIFTRGEIQSLILNRVSPHETDEKVKGRSAVQGTGAVRAHNFPPFSTWRGQGRLGGSSRREIGHGHLAWRAPEADEIPLGEERTPTPRVVVSDILESNGSSSMAAGLRRNPSR